MKGSVNISLVLLALTAASVNAQEIRARTVRPAGVGGFGQGGAVFAAPTRVGGVERILRMKEQLKLTDAQVSQLDAIRKEQVAKRQQEATARIELDSRIAAGLAKREETRDELRDRVEKLRDESEKTQERVNKILTEEQRDKLRDERLDMARRSVVEARAFGRGGMVPRFRERRMPQGGARFYFEPRGRRDFGPSEIRVLPRRRGEF
jgi:Spy/CpxP family protein refolding chaperone